MDARIYDLIFRGSSQFGTLPDDLRDLLELHLQLSNASLENARLAKEEAAAKKAAAEAAKKAAIDQINAELGITNATNGQIGAIESLREKLRLLKQAREQANDRSAIDSYNRAINTTTQELNRLTGATDRFRGSNGFWRELQGQIAVAFATLQITEWTGKIFSAQSQVEAFDLSLDRLVGKNQSAKIQAQLKTLIVDTPVLFEQATKEVEKLTFAYQAVGRSTIDIVKDFEAFGNVSKGNAENLKGVVKALSDVANQQKMTGQETMQFANAGVPIMTLLAESTGMTIKELFKLRKEGGITFDMVREALVKAGSEGGKFFGAMTVQASTLSGMWGKFQDSVFYALANTGNAMAENAKKSLSWAADIVQSLFGTEEAAKETLGWITKLIGTWAAYRIGIAATIAVEKAALIIRGMAILSLESYTGITIASTTAQIAARNAALGFNAALAANPFGLAAAALAALYFIYRDYTEIQREAEKLTISYIKANDQQIASLTQTNIKMGLAVTQIEKLKEGSDLYKQALANLIKVYPAYFSNLDVEKSKMIDVKAAYDKANLAIERKISLMAAEKLAESTTNRLVEIKESLLKRGITTTNVDEFVTNRSLSPFKADTYDFSIIKGQIEEYNRLLGTVQKNTAEVTKQNIINFNAEHIEIKRQLNAREISFADYMTKRENLMYTYHIKERKAETETTTTSGDENDKRLKKNADSLKVDALQKEKANNDALEYTRETELKSLELEKQIAELKIKESTGSKKRKDAALLDLENEYQVKEAQLVYKWDVEKLKKEKVSTDMISKIRADFRALSAKEDLKGLQLQMKQIEEKYDFEIKAVNNSAKAWGQKNLEIFKLIITEEKELATIKNQIEFVKNLDKLHHEQAATIKKLAADYVKKAEIQRDIDQEEAEHQKELIKLYRERAEAINNMVQQIIPETKELFNYQDALNKSADSARILQVEQNKLSETQKTFGLQSKEFAEQFKITNKAEEDSVKASTQVMATQYQLLYKVIETVFNGVKDAISKSLRTIADAYTQANKIYQDFAKQQRDAELASFKSDLNYRLGLVEGNFDAQIDLLKSYFAEADAVINRVNLSEDIANELQKTTEKIVGFTSYVADEIDKFSLNPITNIKNAFGQLGMAIAGWKKENTDAAEKAILAAQSTIKNLEWQRDQSLNLLDDMADTYKNKYDEMTDSVKDGLSTQVDAYKDKRDSIVDAIKQTMDDAVQKVKDGMDQQVNAIRDGLDNQLDALSDWYDGQKELISGKYQDILDNNVRYTDKAFEDQLAIWNNARTEQETILVNQKNAEQAILKQKYIDGNISLEEYTTQNQSIEAKYFTDILALRTIFYDDLQAKTDEYATNEKTKLESDYAAGLITEADYLTKKGDLEDIAKQRSADIKSLVKADRDKDLASLKNDYLDLKTVAEQKAAMDIEKINSDSTKAIKDIQDKAKADILLANTTYNGLIKTAEDTAAAELIRIATEKNQKLADLAKQRRDTELQYNSDIFEQNRAMANAQAVVAMAEAKANAWKNPFTANATINRIHEAFAEIFANIGAAVNPFHQQIVGNSAEDNKNQPVTPGADPGIDTGGIGSFKDGTVRLPRKSGKAGTDTELIFADADERIMEAARNNRIRDAVGYDVSNAEMEKMVIGYHELMPKFINYAGLTQMANTTVSGSDPKLLEAITDLNKGVKSMGDLKQLFVNIENGKTTLTERSSQRMRKHA